MCVDIYFLPKKVFSLLPSMIKEIQFDFVSNNYKF